MDRYLQLLCYETEKTCSEIGYEIYDNVRAIFHQFYSHMTSNEPHILDR